MRNAAGEPMRFEFLAVNRQQERLALNFADALNRVGVKMDIRLVDDAQYWRRLADYDYDMIQWDLARLAVAGQRAGQPLDQRRRRPLGLAQLRRRARAGHRRDDRGHAAGDGTAATSRPRCAPSTGC